MNTIIESAFQERKNLSVAATEAQKEIWFSCKMGATASSAYNESFTIKFTGKSDITTLEKAVRQVVSRHDALRAIFSPDGLSMEIMEANEIVIDFLDLHQKPVEIQKQQIHKLTVNAVSTPFELNIGPLWKACIINLSSNETILLFTVHHIVADGWSVNILTKNFIDTYLDLMHGVQPADSEVPSFFKYVVEQQQFSGTPEADDHLSYWIKKFSKPVPAIELPSEKIRPVIRTYNAACVTRQYSKNLYTSIKQLSISIGCGPFAVFLAAYAILMHKLTGNTSFVIGVPAAGQSFTGNPDLVGHCVSMLPVICTIDPSASFSQNIVSIQDCLYDDLEHFGVTFGELVKKLNIPRDPGRIPLISTGLTYVKQPVVSKLNYADINVSSWLNERTFETFELYGSIIESGDTFSFMWQYNTDLYSEQYVNLWIDEYETLINCGCAAPTTPLSNLSIHTPAQLDALIFGYNQTEMTLPQNVNVVQTFKEMVQQFPDAIAVEFGQNRISYHNLYIKSLRLSKKITEAGAGKGSIIAVCMERGDDMIPALLSVLMTGAAYVPIDPAFPDERISYIVSDSGTQLFLTQNALLKRFSGIQSRVLPVDDLNNDINESENNVFTNINSDDLAYIIYTSGSTGRPKGVEICHGALINFLFSMKNSPGMTSQDSILSVTTISFDIAGLEIFLPLITGARLIIAAKEVISDGKKLAQQIKDCRPSIMQATPSTWTLLLDSGWNEARSMTLLCGGEAMTRVLADRLIATGAVVWNMYGPTETTIWSSLWRVTPGTGTPPIGTPIANTQLYIIDDYKNIVPVGVNGELCIGGKGLARGYHNRQQLTDEKFIPDPFGTQTSGIRQRLYRTGDIARRLFDGSVVLSGRSDFQVKIRGYRIEPGEIESVILSITEIRECVVIDRTDSSGNKILVGYLVLHQGKTMTVDLVQTVLKEKLPVYMVPSQFVFLAELPRLANNKINRAALPQPSFERPLLSTQFTGPKDEMEQTISGIWSEILGVKHFGMLDNFFDLGGHSMAIAQVQKKIADVLHRELEVVRLFEFPTVRSLAEFLLSDNKDHLQFDNLKERTARQRAAFKKRKML